MKREIKFRIWNNNYQELLPVITLDFNNKVAEVLPERNLEGGDTELWALDGSELMENSGAYYEADKSDIFEGDIVLHGESIRTVEKIDSRWTLVSRDRKNGILLSFSHPVYLGNIYQNPELLTPNR